MRVFALSAIDYTLMMLVIKVLTFKIMIVIIKSFELAEPGETHTPKPCEPP
ncbi:MAG: hypothetical protein IPM01_17590 [Burkholderiaceae bacterium]|nr:hypothetical protein [Burkholderiaceae bacterium]